VVSLSGQLEPVDARDATLTVFIECADDAFAKRLEARLETVVEKAREAWPLKDTAVSRPQADLLQVRGRIEDLPTKTADLVAAAVVRAEKTRADEQPQQTAAD